MDLNATAVAAAPQAFDESTIDGPSGDGDPMGTPAANEKVLWKGKPDLAVLSRSAFHIRKVALYFAVLIGISLAFGNTNAAIVCSVLGVAGIALLQGLAWLCRRTTVYILTNDRLIIRKGMAIETRINLPLKQIASANLKSRRNGFGDIAMALKGERLLSYLLLWPHVRRFKFAHPQPTLRAVPDAENVAQILAEACAKHVAIETGNSVSAEQANGPAASRQPAARAQVQPIADRGLEGATA